MINKFKNYFDNYKNLIVQDRDLLKKLETLKKKILECKKKKRKILIFGNGGSASIASHFSIDMTKTANIRCMNFSDPSLITCLSNDYGYENWVKKAIEFYADNGDLLILISSKGMSKNIINAIKNKKIKFSFISTFTGFNKKNKVSKIGDLSFHVDSNKYNFIENIHQLWLLSLVDLIDNNK